MRFSFSPTVRTAHWRSAALAAAVLGLSACADFSGIAPQARMTEPQALGLGTSTVAAGNATPTNPMWWTHFGDAQLNGLVAQALRQSPTVKLAQARIDRALALTDISRSAEVPTVSGSVDATRQRFSANSIYPPPLGGNVYETANLQVTASYELDLFSKTRAQLDAALGQVRAAQADAQVAQLLLATQVTRS